MIPMGNSGTHQKNEHDFNFSLHTKYFSRCLDILPAHTTSLDNTRVAVAFYGLAGLDLLHSLPSSLKFPPSDVISWIYRLQLIADSDACGFRGSPCAVTSFSTRNSYDHVHITMTMTALLSLLLLGDDLSRVDRTAIASSLVHLQLSNGAFLATRLSTESDLRFVYCACCVAFLLDDWSGIDIDLCANFILQCRSYENAFGQVPGAEAHGGSTFCAIAALSLMNRLNMLDRQDDLIRWCLQRQAEGFNGRPNKPDDSCYSWWIGASLKLLKKDSLVNRNCNRTFLQATESKIIGGFSKWPDSSPDPLHSYLSLAALSLMEEKGLKQLHPALIVPMDVIERLQQTIHTQWRQS